MYYFLSLLSGVLISVMVVFNGNLTVRYGVYSATVMIHVAGLLLSAAALFFKKEKIRLHGISWLLMTGGAIGVATTVFNNVAFGRISISAILALGLLGQSVTGLLIDQFGLFGMKKHSFRLCKIGGLVVICTGIASMMTTSFELVAVIVSLLTGVTIVVSRTINAGLAEKTSVYVSTVINYMVGLAVACLVCFVLGQKEPLWTQAVFSWQPYLYAGGLLGAGVVFLSNVTVMKVSAFYMSLLTFVGQIFCGIALDAAIDGKFVAENMIGGVLVALGMGINLLVDRRHV